MGRRIHVFQSTLQVADSRPKRKHHRLQGRLGPSLALKKIKQHLVAHQ
jgi:hypothetical protein